MKTYYDGEEREIVSITHYSNVKGRDWWKVVYTCEGRGGELVVPANDELDAMRVFPIALEIFSIQK